MDVQQDELRIENIPIMREFLDVFLDDLPRLPPDREIDFSIDLISSTGPISKILYRMALVELRELKDKIQDMLDKGFIWSSVSP